MLRTLTRGKNGKRKKEKGRYSANLGRDIPVPYPASYRLVWIVCELFPLYILIYSIFVQPTSHQKPPYARTEQTRTTWPFLCFVRPGSSDEPWRVKNEWNININTFLLLFDNTPDHILSWKSFFVTSAFCDTYRFRPWPLPPVTFFLRKIYILLLNIIVSVINKIKTGFIGQLWIRVDL